MKKKHQLGSLQVIDIRTTIIPKCEPPTSWTKADIILDYSRSSLKSLTLSIQHASITDGFILSHSHAHARRLSLVLSKVLNSLCFTCKTLSAQLFVVVGAMEEARHEDFKELERVSE